MTYHYGSINVSRNDASGYTRLTIVEEQEFRFGVITEWILFDEPLPETKPEAAKGRLFKFYDRVQEP